ncbi:YraN family protein [Actimicrobium sp. CCI2.3]|uniref:YraN family protein n=1 Tax=Actimicrobium sp. CCI2.3 TaxID=3048616 RepID=UPI002AB45FA7|nr:YraN family protein [Actimicrobium sp. CCI2.3]MDY7576444.1 YraN family protein [Actimicrobium sp. CCI2.3]MEB0021577.1 YraN family protein [Actimicrobium sp. CCI2.3]
MGLFRASHTDQQRSGDTGEDLALAYLQQQGLVLIERNFSCKGGELDLIMQAGAVLVFVEVRRRATAGFGGAAASITVSKQRRLVVAAQCYLQRYRGNMPPCRFDVVAIDGAVITWLQNAFDS